MAKRSPAIMALNHSIEPGLPDICLQQLTNPCRLFCELFKIDEAKSVLAGVGLSWRKYFCVLRNEALRPGRAVVKSEYCT
jgi:hypothetical protein